MQLQMAGTAVAENRGWRCDWEVEPERIGLVALIPKGK